MDEVLDERKRKILKAIIKTYMETGEPVGSRTISKYPDMKRSVKKYSLGMRQRLGLAQAIMEDPSVLVLDEPFNGLDKEGVVEMRQYLLQLKDAGKAIMVCSHSSEDIAVLCDRVYEMEHGKLTPK